MNEVTIFGNITKDARVSAVVTPEYNEMLKANPGERVIINISICSEKGTILQKIYFRRAVRPCLQKGFEATGDYMSPDEVEKRVREMCPATTQIDPEDDLSREQWSRLIDWSIQICAENFGIVAPDPEGS